MGYLNQINYNKWSTYKPISGQDTRAIRQNGWRNCRDKKERYFSRHNYSWNQIDQLVYKLYELTEEEIKIIEGN